MCTVRIRIYGLTPFRSLCHSFWSVLNAAMTLQPHHPTFGLTGAAPVASWNTNRTRPPRLVQAECSTLCSLELDLPKLLFKKFSGNRVQVRGRWVSQGFSRSFWWPWRTARKSWLWLRRFLLLPLLHDSVAERHNRPAGAA